MCAMFFLFYSLLTALPHIQVPRHAPHSYVHMLSYIKYDFMHICIHSHTDFDTCKCTHTHRALVCCFPAHSYLCSCLLRNSLNGATRPCYYVSLSVCLFFCLCVSLEHLQSLGLGCSFYVWVHMCSCPRERQNLVDGQQIDYCTLLCISVWPHPTNAFAFHNR